jgi:hypothetical protein
MHTGGLEECAPFWRSRLRFRLSGMNIKRLLAAAAMTAGLAIGLAATASAEPIGQIGDEAGFNECIKEHPDDEGFAVCCVFYGGSLDEGPNHQACVIGPVTSPEDEEASAPQWPKGPIVVRPGLIDSVQILEPATTAPVLTPVSRAPIANLG